MEALGKSLDRFLEALGRMTESGYQRKQPQGVALNGEAIHTNGVSNRWPNRMGDTAGYGTDSGELLPCRWLILQRSCHVECGMGRIRESWRMRKYT